MYPLQFVSGSITLLLLSTKVSAFTLEGWLGQRCSGEEVFSRNLGLQDGCVTTGMGQAESVTIQTQDTDQPNDRLVVAFYRTDDCSVTELITTSSGGGCANIDDTGDLVYMSFRVVRA
ncbi:hypothetical protein D6C95_08060 [Aureobasidium pullulans]|nr:hypothetical protein D6C95_08060 [Aureobasidium pullulans]